MFIVGPTPKLLIGKNYKYLGKGLDIISHQASNKVVIRAG